ncbi:uncharacterized protein LOC141629082 [Silene latifolia]|uniref:uncharacterized protein LOC141629082 n=1 Tax=Silene latifolia TaxID=37657 RepID=UPI003D775FD7
MGTVLGGRMQIQQLEAYAKKYWTNAASPVIQYYRKGWFSFRFSAEEDMNTVLKGGPWNMGPHTLILKRWSPTFSQEMESITTVPIWILFPNLDPFLWSSSTLSKLASKIGKPLFADLPTTCKAKLSFARVMVETDIAEPLPDELLFSTPYHEISSQRVTYEWMPYYCENCKKLGHTKDHCKPYDTGKQQDKTNPKGKKRKKTPTVTSPTLVPTYHIRMLQAQEARS